MTFSSKNQSINWEQAVLWLKSQPDKKQLVKDCYYDDPLIKSAERFYLSKEWYETRKLLPYGKGIVLDIGAGRGISSYALARDGWKVKALEPDSSKIIGSGAIKKIIKQAKLKINIAEGYGENIPFKNCYFDLVYTRQCLHHASDLEKYCGEVNRVLKKGGVFLATREHVLSSKEDLSVFLDNHPLHFLYGGEHAYTLKEYLYALNKSGLRIIKIIPTFDSDINLFPDNKDRIIKSMTFGIRMPDLIQKAILKYLNYRNNSPGRLYSFLLVK